MKCTMCGTENEAGAKFCTSCGAKLVEADIDLSSTVSQPEVSEAVPEETVSAAQEQEEVQAPLQGIEGLADEQLSKAEEAVNEAAESLSDAASEGLGGGSEPDSSGNVNGAEYSGGYSNDYNAKYDDVYVEEGGGYIGFAIASLVCGCLSILCCAFSCIDTPLSLAAIILGIVTIVKAYDGKGFAIAGIATGAVGILLQLVSFFMFSSAGFFD
ncbi:MAG: DUF4190 domain-containing protein [Lachnospiraceae bacterium]|nr:DUF4190 domain-containing protein [Lachnospiraceae bacterium]